MTTDNQIKWLGFIGALLTAFVGVFAADIGDLLTRIVSFAASAVSLALWYFYGVQPARKATNIAEQQQAAMAEMLKNEGQGHG